MKKSISPRVYDVQGCVLCSTNDYMRNIKFISMLCCRHDNTRENHSCVNVLVIKERKRNKKFKFKLKVYKKKSPHRLHAVAIKNVCGWFNTFSAKKITFFLLAFFALRLQLMRRMKIGLFLRWNVLIFARFRYSKIFSIFFLFCQI